MPPSVLPRRVVPALLIPDRLVRLPKPFHFSAFQVSITHPVATTANRIDRGTPRCAADPHWLSHGFGKKDPSYRPVFLYGWRYLETYNPDRALSGMLGFKAAMALDMSGSGCVGPSPNCWYTTRQASQVSRQVYRMSSTGFKPE